MSTHTHIQRNIREKKAGKDDLSRWYWWRTQLSIIMVGLCNDSKINGLTREIGYKYQYIGRYYRINIVVSCRAITNP